MIIYPRSLSGFNLNPNKDEQKFQHNEIDMLLKRLKFGSYFKPSGWDTIKRLGSELQIWKNTLTFKFEKVFLHTAFTTKIPLTVTGAYLNLEGEVIFHQMVLDRVENGEYVLQNTLHSVSPPQLRVSLKNRYYVNYDMMERCHRSWGAYEFNKPGKFLQLTNERCKNMDEEKWYLLPQAYCLYLCVEKI